MREGRREGTKDASRSAELPKKTNPMVPGATASKKGMGDSTMVDRDVRGAGGKAKEKERECMSSTWQGVVTFWFPQLSGRSMTARRRPFAVSLSWETAFA